MLLPRSIPNRSDVALHYDELGFLYRHLWGEHLHHGVWETAEDLTVREATIRLLELLTAPLDLAPTQRVVDIGCGYGADARWMAEAFGVEVTGITISPTQAELAASAPPPTRGRVEINLGDWLANRFSPDSFDTAVAIESLDHMPDKPAFFRELHRTLKGGGRAAIACWTVASDLTVLERTLLRRLCYDGRLPSLGTLEEYEKMARAAGLRVLSYRDLTDQVAPTWRIIGRRAIVSLFTDLRFSAEAARHCLNQPAYALTIPNMLLSYHLRALGYGILWLEK